MAIEIAPEKKESNIGQYLLLMISSVILLVAFAVYFYYSAMAIPAKAAEIIKLNGDLNAAGGNDIVKKEEQLLLAKKYIDDFKVLYQNNPKSSQFFESFQRWSHPRVVYSGFSFDIVAKKVTVSGNTAGFENVMEQIAILNKELGTKQAIEDYTISNIALAEMGGVSFNLDITLSPQLLK